MTSNVKCLFAATTLAILACVSSFGYAAPQPPASSIKSQTSELVVFEIEGCPYCILLRRDVLPGYMKSRRGQRVPMRFVNIFRADVSKMRLRRPLEVVPTVVLMENGEETGRISGYSGPEHFYHLISVIMRK